jgi:predicted  nucleic acid-binding Zn-ribbon protein
MLSSLNALLDLQVIDHERQKHLQARLAKAKKLAVAQAQAAAAASAAEAAQGEVGKLDALIRQYTTDVERCDATVTELKAKQPEAKTNKEYMDLVNGIEAAKLEKVKREASLKELKARTDALQAKADEAKTKADTAAATAAQVAVAAAGSDQPTAEEKELQSRYDAKKQEVEPAFLEQYERLVKSKAKQPLLRVDPTSRATPFGALLSPNKLEQLRAGKLVIDQQTNAILYLG